jgi:3-hydroxyacyl-CoA dehydrogenase
MKSVVSVSKKDDIAIITFDNPPVNALSHGVPEGIAAAVASANSDMGVRAMVITGGGRMFSAGADINEFAEMLASGKNDSPALHTFLQELEDSPKPVIMAIRGTALGGGLELAMAGHYRIATADAQLGQPEVNLGIIPGAEGTQRLPRLVGLARAVDMCVSGQPLKAAEALQAGLIDHIIEGDLLTGAVAFARAVPASTSGRKTRERTDRLGQGDAVAILSAGREQAAKTRRNMMAPLAALDALQAAVSLPFEQGCNRERELVAQCFASTQAKALIHAFLGERVVAKVPDIPQDTPTVAIQKAAIIGSGTMGSGIAMAFANAGIPVWLHDADASALARGMANIRKNYENSVKKGRFSQQTMAERMALIHPLPAWDGVEQADIVIEAVFENLALKKEVFARIDKVAKPGCVLATNTSTLNIDEIAGATTRPQMVIGLHFFSPANVMRLVEVVRGRSTSKEVIATAMALAKKLRKVGVLVGNNFGFVGNRMMFPYMREAQFLVEEGATPEQVDRALYDWGMAMGIFAVDDMGGIDVAWRVKQESKHLQKPGVRVPLVLDKLYAMGRWGQKTNAGWYLYDENRRATPDPAVEELIRQTAREAGIAQRAISPQEIIERCIYVMINEGARILEEGYAQRAVDIDIIYLTGYGFPAYRGGPMWYADTVGLEKVYRRIEEFHQQHGELWTPAPLLRRLVEQGKTFAALDAEIASRNAYA